jgi:hypothetical protein
MAGKKSKAGVTLENERGQSIVLVAIMILSFLMFFTFALNTGLLIHAKISVQSAADAAAYAGAATQGRYLNSISFLNYDMRRQYKKFLFRNVFIGALGSPDFPKTSTNQTTGRYDFPKFDFSLGTPQKVPLKVPVVCVPLIARGNNSDRCMQLNMRNTSKDIKDKLGVLPGGGSSIIQALIESNQQISSAIQKTCVGQSGINQAVLISWLFKGESNETYIVNLVDSWFNSSGGAANQNKGEITSLIQGLVKGLGLYPRNILNLMRIETLRDFINTPHQENVDIETVESLERDQNKAERMERTILAFKSALSNLNSSVFDPTTVQMDELQPDSMLQLQPHMVTGLNVFYQASTVDGTVDENDPTFCKSFAKQLTLEQIPVGVKRLEQGTKNIVYAVKIRAFIKPRGLLFAPWGEDLELTAVAGAKPFGSRIGPKEMDPYLVFSGGGPLTGMNGVKINGQKICDALIQDECPIPNLVVGDGKTFHDTEFLVQMKNIATNNAGGNSFSLEGIEKAQYHAMAPNPPEVGRYGIIPPPPVSDPSKMSYQFIPYYDGKGIAPTTQFKLPIPVYRFYAPIFPKSQGNSTAYVTNFLSFLKNVNAEFGFDPVSTYNTVRDSLLSYMNGPLSTGNGSENLESTTFAAIELPMYNLIPPLSPFWLEKGNQVLTSWAPTNIRTSEGGFAPVQRFGYSVKHVALRELTREGVTTVDDELESIPH